jgi:hypothetical protein
VEKETLIIAVKKSPPIFSFLWEMTPNFGTYWGRGGGQ